MNRNLISCGLLFIVIGARISWQSQPTLFYCSWFWFAVAVDRLIGFVVLGYGLTPPRLIGTLGMAMNAAVTLANCGVMPVVGQAGSFVSVWVKAQPHHHLLWLCDRLRGGCSPGDICIFVGIITTFFCPKRYDLLAIAKVRA